MNARSADRTTGAAVPTFRLSGRQIRSRRFDVVPRRVRGLDPHQVYAYLEQVAAEFEAEQQDIYALTEENARLKDAIRVRRAPRSSQPDLPPADPAPAPGNQAPPRRRTDRPQHRWPQTNCAATPDDWPRRNTQ